MWLLHALVLPTTAYSDGFEVAEVGPDVAEVGLIFSLDFDSWLRVGEGYEFYG